MQPKYGKDTARSQELGYKQATARTYSGYDQDTARMQSGYKQDIT